MRKVVLILISLSLIVADQSVKAQSNSGDTRQASSDKPTMFDNLQGMWRSLNNKKITFTNRSYERENNYNGEVTDTLLLNFYDRCPSKITGADPKRTSGKYLVYISNGAVKYCYRINRIDVHNIVVTSTKTHKVLRYKKVYIARAAR